MPDTPDEPRTTSGRAVESTAAENEPGAGQATGRAEPGAPPPAANQPGDQQVPVRGQGDERGGDTSTTPVQPASADMPAPDASRVADAATGTPKTGPEGTTTTPHTARSGSNATGQDALVGRQSAPDGEVGST